MVYTCHWEKSSGLQGAVCICTLALPFVFNEKNMWKEVKIRNTTRVAEILRHDSYHYEHMEINCPWNINEVGGIPSALHFTTFLDYKTQKATTMRKYCSF